MGFPRRISCRAFVDWKTGQFTRPLLSMLSKPGTTHKSYQVCLFWYPEGTARPNNHHGAQFNQTTFPTACKSLTSVHKKSANSRRIGTHGRDSSPLCCYCTTSSIANHRETLSTDSRPSHRRTPRHKGVVARRTVTCVPSSRRTTLTCSIPGTCIRRYRKCRVCASTHSANQLCASG